MAVVALEIEKVLAEEAKERMSAGGGDKKSGKETFPYPIENQGQARDQAAAIAGTNGHTSRAYRASNRSKPFPSLPCKAIYKPVVRRSVKSAMRGRVNVSMRL